MKYTFFTKPYKHQRRALVRFFKQKCLAVLWEPGLGKSKFVVDASCAGFQMGKFNRVAIFCPLSVVGVWEDEFDTHSTSDYRMLFLDKRDKRITDYGEGELQILVVNYDLAWRRKKIIKSWRPQFVVADESHKIKRAGTRRSRYMRSHNQAPYRAILTGTPNPQGFRDLYGQWAFVNPERFGLRLNDFDDRYVIFGGYRGYQIKGYRHRKELKRLVAMDATVVRKDQALDLPERTWQRVPVYLEDEAEHIYRRLEEDYFHTLENGEMVDIKMALNRTMKLQQVLGGFVSTDQGWRQVSNVKFEALLDFSETVWNMDDKMVVVARYLPEIELIDANARKAKVRTFVIKGGMKREERDHVRREFQLYRGAANITLQIQTGGLGITLHTANQGWFHSVTFALDDYIQACDRLHRIGQDRKVTYRHPMARNTVDLDIYRSLRNKKKVMDVIMGRNGETSSLTSRWGNDNVST